MAFHGQRNEYPADPAWRDLVLFHETFHGDTGRGLGASHQTGWTALVVLLLEDVPRGESAGQALGELASIGEQAPAR